MTSEIKRLDKLPSGLPVVTLAVLSRMWKKKRYSYVVLDKICTSGVDEIIYSRPLKFLTYFSKAVNDVYQFQCFWIIVVVIRLYFIHMIIYWVLFSYRNANKSDAPVSDSVLLVPWPWPETKDYTHLWNMCDRLL